MKHHTVFLECVKNMAEVFGENRPVGFAREITKTFETIKNDFKRFGQFYRK